MIYCTKTFPNIPFAHRQFRHKGHCAQIHGHNWDIMLTFGCVQVDECGFVMDFGDLQCIKDFIAKYLDHAIVLAKTDPMLQTDAYTQLVKSGIFVPFLVDDPSCEGLCYCLFGLFYDIINKHTKGRVHIMKIEIREGANASATYCPDAFRQ